MLSTLQDSVSNPDIAEPFTILRNMGVFGEGGWVASTPEVITVYGTVSVAGQRELQVLPEADRSNESRVFHSVTPMFVTDGDRSGTSDILVWRGENYRVLAVRNYDQRGYWAAIGVRTLGT